MRARLPKPVRMVWRMSRNLACATPLGRRVLFPPGRLAEAFGPADAAYAWRVFRHHAALLERAGFRSARQVLEVGPGRNLGSALLWWCRLQAQEGGDVNVVCWDVYPNASVGSDWRGLAQALLEDGMRANGDGILLDALRAVAGGTVQPRIEYRVEPVASLERAVAARLSAFDLTYSQAVIEHVWFVDDFWNALGRMTAPGGWHSHRIDLADHGARDANYVEMLEWSRLGYWLTMRAVPGAVNRWRACQHIAKLEDLGFTVVVSDRVQRESLPVPLRRISSPFRRLGEAELRTTALDVAAVRTA